MRLPLQPQEPSHGESADALVIGAGLAGLVAANELAGAGKKVLLLDQEPEASLGGQAFWSLGGIFLVDSPEQRRMGIRDSHELALTDWMGTAGFDRGEDLWPRRWAEAYVAFAAGESDPGCAIEASSSFPWSAGRARRLQRDRTRQFRAALSYRMGDRTGVVAPFAQRARAAAERGQIVFKFRHRVTGLVKHGEEVVGARGEIWSRAPRSAAKRAHGRRSRISNSWRRR